MSTSFGWKVNRHTTRCTGPVSVVLQNKLVSAEGCENEYYRRPVGPFVSGVTIFYVPQPTS